MKQIPSWVLASAGASPVFLIGGWTIAGGRQKAGYDPVRDTISALAAYGATDRWLMTTALAGLGAGYLFTALGLRPARLVGRLVLAVGGVATVFVAIFPQPTHGNSTAHTVSATVAFLSLAVWPVFAARRSCISGLAPKYASVATTIMLSLLAWFVFEIHGGERGLAERAVAGAESLWPLVVVASGLRTPKHFA
jgi:hypothetical membrane protein